MNDLIPTEFYLGQNYPNPFKEKTTIKYCIPYKIKVKITVYDSDGEMVEKLVDEEKDPGTYKSEFPLPESRLSGSKSKKRFEKGNYMYRLEAGNYTREKQMKVEK